MRSVFRFCCLAFCLSTLADNELTPAGVECDDLDALSTKTIYLNKVGGKMELGGDVDKTHLTNKIIAKQFAAFMGLLGKTDDIYTAWHTHNPFGLNYPLHGIKAPQLSRKERNRIREAIDVAFKRRGVKAVAPESILSTILQHETRILKDNLATLERDRQQLTILEGKGEKPKRQQRFRDEIAKLEIQNLELEEAILAKYSAFMDVPGIVIFQDQDFTSIADAAFTAALHRANRLNTPYRIFEVRPGEKGIEYLPDENTDIGKLQKTITKMTEKQGEPYKLAFAPHSAIKTRLLAGNLYSVHGIFGISPQYLLVGKEDLLATPLQLRGLQVHLMKHAGAPTPFRGIVTHDASNVENPELWSLAHELILGPFIRNVPKALKNQPRSIQVDIASRLHDALAEDKLFKFVSAAQITDRMASRVIEKLAQPGDDGIDFRAAPNNNWHVDVADDRSPGQLLGRISFFKGGNGTYTMQLHSPYCTYLLSLNGKDLQPALKELTPLFALNSESATSEQKTQARENLIRLLRVV